jgi:hypothetical protein
MARPSLSTWGGLLLTSALLGGCGDGESSSTGEPQPTTGNAKLTFSVTDTVRASMSLMDTLDGVIYGSVFLAEDVNLAGPIDGAEQFGSVEVSGIDLEADMTSGNWDSPDLEPQTYVFLGFFDVDGNGAETTDPDEGDPVTLPTSNEFTVVTGETTEATVAFDLVF